MAEYKDIKGFKVQTVSTDPAASIVATGTWATGTSLNTARRSVGGNGTQTEALASGGFTTTNTGVTELYNGSSWTEVNDMNTARRGPENVGTQTAALTIGGYVTAVIANTESWNGTSWTEVNDLNQGRGFGAAAGDQTAGLFFGGSDPAAAPPGDYENAESWNGTSWTAITNMTTKRNSPGGLGTQTSALAIGGVNTAPLANVEFWNGSSWTEIADLNTARYGVGAAGLYTAGLVFGGEDGITNVTLTEAFDGTSWTEVSDLATARNDGTNFIGTQSSALYAGGQSPITAATEEWTVAPPTSFSKENLGQIFYNSTSNAFKVTGQPVSSGTWASGGNVNTARTNGTGGGIQTAGLFSGGEGPSPTTQSLMETYDGTSWTEVNNLNSGRIYAFGAGLQNAAWTAGGFNPSSPLTYRTETEFWDGTNWTIVPATLNTARAQGMSAGVQTSAIAACGEGPGPDPRTYYGNAEELDGTTWTNVANVNRTPDQSRRFGSTNIGRSASAMRIVGGGYSSPPTTVGFNEEFNGTSWTEGTDLNTARGARPGSSGSVNDGLFWGGGPDWSIALTNTEYWNGTSWTELNDLVTGTNFGGSGGITGNSALLASGYGGAPVGPFDYTQEWNTTITNSTLTAS